MGQSVWRRGLLAGLLLIGSFPGIASAQIWEGEYLIFRDKLAEVYSPPWTPATTSSSAAGWVMARRREPGASHYVEHWVLPSGPLLLQHSIAEIRPIRTAEETTARKRLDPARSIVTDAWSQEEVRASELSVAELVSSAAPHGHLHLEIAEILQVDGAPGRLSDGVDAPVVGWVMEWTDADGTPVAQDWWLTARYEYPSPEATVRTFLRTLDDKGRAERTRREIVKHIAVELAPASPLELAIDTGSEEEGEVEDGDGTELPAPASRGGGCATGHAPGGSSLLLLGSLAFGLIWRRRRRHAGSS